MFGQRITTVTYRNLRFVVLAIIVMLVIPFVAFAQQDANTPAARIQRLMNEGFNQGNINVVDELFAENYIVHPSGGNRDAFKESAIALRGMFPDVHAQADDIVSQGNWASFRFTMSGTFVNPYTTSQGSIAPTNQFTTLTMQVFLRYNEQGQVVEEWDYMDNYSFLAQIGVLPSVNATYAPATGTSDKNINAKMPTADTSADNAISNKAHVQRVFDEVLNMRNTSVSSSLFAQNFTYHGVQGTSNLSNWTGSVDSLLAAMPDLYVTPEIMIAEGNLVSVRYTMRGTFLYPLVMADGTSINANGQYVELPGSMVIRFDDSGKIVDTYEVFDNLSLLTQMGIFSW